MRLSGVSAAGALGSILLLALTLAWALVLALLLGACSRSELFHHEAYVFGTRVELAIAGTEPAVAEAAGAAVLREFDRLHRAYHAWEPSELSTLNEVLAAGGTATVSPELAFMLADAQRIAVTGDELFNPALGALIALWGFHGDSFAALRPEPAALQRLLAAAPRMADLHIEGVTIRSDNPAVQLDLGGYAKGYALDRAAVILREHGVRNALINIGGNVLALGDKGGQPWRIGIQHPRQPAPLATLPLYDGEAIGTSGDYQRYFMLDEERYSHLLDPRSGQPSRATQSLTVLVQPDNGWLRPAEDGLLSGVGTLSDAASKPAFIAGDDWLAYSRRYQIKHALRVAADGRIEVSAALRARLQLVGKPDLRVVD